MTIRGLYHNIIVSFLFNILLHIISARIIMLSVFSIVPTKCARIMLQNKNRSFRCVTGSIHHHFGHSLEASDGIVLYSFIEPLTYALIQSF